MDSGHKQATSWLMLGVSVLIVLGSLGLIVDAVRLARRPASCKRIDQLCARNQGSIRAEVCEISWEIAREAQVAESLSEAETCSRALQAFHMSMLLFGPASMGTDPTSRRIAPLRI